MSAVIKKILDDLPPGGVVEDVAVYLHATVVTAEHVGLAYTFPKRSRDDPRFRDEIIANHGRLRAFTCRELANYALSKHQAEAAVGVAAINAMLPLDASRVEEKNGVDIVMQYAARKRLAVIGHFPFVERIQPLVKTLWVLEIDPMVGDLPASEAPNIIPHADVVAITGTTLINHTLDELLTLAKGKKVILLGPSTVMSPVLFECGVSALCGIEVTNPEIATRILKEGGSFRHLQGVRQVCMLAS